MEPQAVWLFLAVAGVFAGGYLNKPLNLQAENYTCAISGLTMKTVHSSTTYYAGGFDATNKGFASIAESTSASITSFTLDFASDYTFAISFGTTPTYLYGKADSTSLTTASGINMSKIWTVSEVALSNGTGKLLTTTNTTTAGGIVYYGKTGVTNVFIDKKGASVSSSYSIAYFYTGEEFSTWILTDSNFTGKVCAEKAYLAKCRHLIANVGTVSTNAAARYTAGAPPLEFLSKNIKRGLPDE